ncbi:glutathione S-transferase family protein [Methylobacterium sp. Leaf106]|uniref:glutathione S-transferase family protein n=1 Tax=Methylobacterium sp. Leaf106 TaxID=1736255 RepID=UPI0006F6D5B5|nr:glutathione S-transferase [Methylobacterium sp. Leaf106]KQP41918.1 glutathione S-transferase [Methylobacterium sp. Leaf106]
MKIYDREAGPHPARIRIVLGEKGLEERVEFVSVDLMAAEQKQPAFLAMNPIGKVPVLELDDGTIISESTAITEYFDTLDGDPTLTGRTPREKGVIHMMQRRAEMMLIDAVDDYFHYGTPGLGGALRPWRMPDWSGAKEWGQRRGAYAVANMPYFNGVLANQPYLAGEHFSMADITLFAGLMFADIVALPIAPELAALHAWRGKVADRPAVKNRSGQVPRPEDLARYGDAA